MDKSLPDTLTDYDSKKNPQVYHITATVLQKLDYPGIPKVGKYGRFNYFPRESTIALPCFVMEWIEGENLTSYLEMRDFRPISEQAAIAFQKIS